MSSSPIVASRGGKSSVSTPTTSKEGFKVQRGGHGILFGDEHGATPGEIHFEGAIKSLTPITGQFQTPVIGTEDGEFCVGKTVIDASKTTITKFDIMGGLKGMICTKIIVKRPTGTLPVGLKGKIGTVPTVTDPSLLADEFDIGGLTGYMVRITPGIEKLSEPVFLHYKPSGPAGEVGQTFEVEVWGYTEFYSNIPKPLDHTSSAGSVEE